MTAPTQTTGATTGFGTLTSTGSASVNFAGCLARIAANCFTAPPVIARSAGATARVAPGAPGDLSATASGNTVTLQWSAPSAGDAPTSYIVEAGSASSLADLANFWTQSTSTTFTAGDIPAGTYYVRVRATNADFGGGGTSGPSNEATLTVGTTSCVVPGPPSNLTLMSNSGGVVGLTWTAGGGTPTSYVLEVGSRSGANDLGSRDLGSAATSATASDVGAGTYYVRVRATNRCGTSDPSNELILVVGGSNPTPTTTRIIALAGSLAFGDVAMGSSATRTLTISNSGTGVLTWTGLSTGTAAVTASTTSGTVAAGASQTVTLTFSPTTATSYSGTVTVTSDATSGPNTVAFSGNGISSTAAARIIGLSGDLAFGTVTVGSSTTRTLTISNSGTSPLTWSGLSTGSAEVTAGATTGTIAPGGSVAVTLTYTPAAAVGCRGTVTVTSDATSGTNTLAYSGTGTTATVLTRVIALSGDLSFGSVTVGASATRTLTISNGGNSTLTWSSLNTGTAAVTASTTSGSVAAGGSQAVTLTFSPTAATSYSGTVTVTSDATSGTSTLAFFATGTTGTPNVTRIIGLSGDLAFGNVGVGSSATRTLTISNSGTGPLTWSGLSVGTTAVSASATSGSISAGASQTVTLTFTPTAATSYSGTVTLTSDATSGTNTIAFSGTGTTATVPTTTRIIGLAGSLFFGTVNIGSSVTGALQILNYGNAPLTVSNISTGMSAVTISATTGIVPPGGRLDFTATFTPSAAMYYNGVVTVTSDATSGGNTIAFWGTGVAPATSPTRIIGLSGDLAFGAVSVGLSVTKTLTISNTGNSELTWTAFNAGTSAVTAQFTTASVQAGSSLNVPVTFSPTTPGSYSGTITITSNATAGTNTIAFSGTSVASAAATRIISVTGDLAFGYVPFGSSATKTLTITNTGNTPLTFTRIIGGADEITASPASGTVTAGGVVTVTLTFRPINAGVLSGNIWVWVYSDATSGLTNTTMGYTAISASYRGVP